MRAHLTRIISTWRFTAMRAMAWIWVVSSTSTLSGLYQIVGNIEDEAEANLHSGGSLKCNERIPLLWNTIPSSSFKQRLNFLQILVWIIRTTLRYQNRTQIIKESTKRVD